VLEVEPTDHPGRAATKSGQNLLEAENLRRQYFESEQLNQNRLMESIRLMTHAIPRILALIL